MQPFIDAEFDNPKLLNPKDRFNEAKIFMLLKGMKEDNRRNFLSSTAEELLDMAIYAEDTAKSCGPFDIAYAHFITEAQQCLKLAEMMEIRQRYIHLLQ